MFNPLKMAGDLKGLEKMLKPALEKFMNESGFAKQDELKNRIIEMIHNQLFNNVCYRDGKTINNSHLNAGNLKKICEDKVIDPNKDQKFTESNQ